MKRKIFYFLVLTGVISCFLFTYCGGGGKYSEVKKLLKDSIEASEKLYKEIDSAKDGKAVANALREYIKVMKVLSPKVEALSEKYPELEDNPPEELNDLMMEFEESLQGMMKVMQKAMKYMDDPEVIKVMEEFQNM
ncbi:MAG: hypothetical protein JXB88_25025 [Spirochaetales bacterium]|nr:hypothetical protein [Spirochaetales bacterium]